MQYHRFRRNVLCFCTLLLCFSLVMGGLFILSCSDDDDDDADNPTPTVTPTPTAPPTPSARQLTDDEAMEMYNRVWPGGETILFEQPVDGTRAGIFTAPIDGSLTKTNVSPGVGTYHYPDVNSAATHLCYATGVTDADIWEIGLCEVGGQETILTNNAATNGLDAHFPVFDAEGTRIAYVRRDWNTRTDQIVLILLETGEERVIHTLTAGITTSIECMDWLNTTNAVIFTTRNRKLYRLEMTEGHTPVELATGSDYHTCSSSWDGTKILSAQTAGAGQAYVEMNADGSGKRTLVTEDEYPQFAGIFCQVCWMPDRQTIVGMATDVVTENFDFYLFMNYDN